MNYWNSAFAIFTIAVFSNQNTNAESVKLRAIQIDGAIPFCCTGDKASPGFTIDLVNAINKTQKDFEIELQIVPSKRFYKELLPQQSFDFVFFQDPKFSFEGNFKEVSEFGIAGKEIFFSLTKNANYSQYFRDKSIKNKSIAGREGYTYEFAQNTIKDYDKIYKQFNVSLVNSDEQVVDMVLKGRCQVGVVEYHYLRYQNKINQDVAKNIFISKRADSPNFRQMIITRKSKITAKQLDAILSKLYKDNTIQQIADKYNIEGFRVPAQ